VRFEVFRVIRSFPHEFVCKILNILMENYEKILWWSSSNLEISSPLTLWSACLNLIINPFLFTFLRETSNGISEENYQTSEWRTCRTFFWSEKIGITKLGSWAWVYLVLGDCATWWKCQDGWFTICSHFEECIKNFPQAGNRSHALLRSGPLRAPQFHRET